MKNSEIFIMTLFKILLIVLFCCVFPVVIVLKIWAHFVALHTEKKNDLRRQKLLSYLPIKTVPELLKVLETEAQKPKEYYLKTYYITTELHFNDMCLIQGENNWLVCYVDWHSFTDEHYFQTEQKPVNFSFTIISYYKNKTIPIFRVVQFLTHFIFDLKEKNLLKLKLMIHLSGNIKSEKEKLIYEKKIIFYFIIIFN